MDIQKEVELIKTKENLASFLHLISADYKDNPSEWSNADLPSFLEAMAAWVEDMDGYYLNKNQNPPTQPAWKTLAEIIAAARSYE